MEYFEIDHSVEGDFDDPSYKLCGFCKDVGVVWYDEDFMGIIPRREQDVCLDDILAESAIDDDELPLVKARCVALGLSQANAFFWYQDESLALEKPIRDFYNGLKYVGVFKCD